MYSGRELLPASSPDLPHLYGQNDVSRVQAVRHPQTDLVLDGLRVVVDVPETDVMSLRIRVGY